MKVAAYHAAKTFQKAGARMSEGSTEA